MDFRIEEPFASELERMAVVSWRGRGGGGVVDRGGGMGRDTVWVTLYDVVIAVHNDGVPGFTAR